MASRGGLILMAIFMIILATPALLGAAQPSADEAKAKFESLGCTGCHNGGVAPTWDEVVEDVKSWKSKYGSLDKAVASEVDFFGKKFNTFDEMMAEMAKSSAAGTPDNPDFQVIYQYLKALYEGGGAGGGTQTQTQTQGETQTGTQQTQTQETGTATTATQEETGQETATGEQAKGPILGFGQIVGIAILILIIIVGIAFFLSRK